MAGGGASSGIIPSGVGIPTLARVTAAIPIHPSKADHAVVVEHIDHAEREISTPACLRPAQTLCGSRLPNSNHHRFAASRQARRSATSRGIFSSYSACSRALDAGRKAANPQAVRDREWRCSISLLLYICNRKIEHGLILACRHSATASL